MKNIPSDQLTALRMAHLHFGRHCKLRIRLAWINGSYADFPSYIPTDALQRFRNAEHGGPAGLAMINLKQLSRNAGI